MHHDPSDLGQSPEEGKMSSAQFKIFNGDKKNKGFELITYQKFACEVKQRGIFGRKNSKRCPHSV